MSRNAGKGKTASSRVVARDFETGGSPSPVQQSGSSHKNGKTTQTAISIPSEDEEDEEDEDEEDEFEEVPIPNAVAGPSSPPRTPGNNLRHNLDLDTPGTGTNTTAPSVDDDFEGFGEDDGEEEDGAGDGVIRVEFGGESAEAKAKRIALALRKKPMTSKDRAIRLEAHKLHVIALLASARIRNRWAGNSLLKARLLSMLPHPLQAALVIPPARFPDRAHRSRLFFDALQNLVTWWTESFFDVSDNALGLRTRPWDEVQEIVDTLPKLTKADFVGTGFLGNGKGKERSKEEEEDFMTKLETNAGGERLRTVNSLMKKALKQEGSRDIKAILFVSLARAAGLGARLVTSLQPVPWRAEKSVVKKKSTGAGRGGKSVASRQGNGAGSDDDEDDEDDMEEVPIPLAEDKDGGPIHAKDKVKKSTVRQAGRRRHIDPADVYRLRAPKPAPKTAGGTQKKKAKVLDLKDQPPVFWAEVYSRSDQRWIPVDPVRGVIRKKSEYEPASDSGPIRMTYVVAFEEDHFARDVTLRYTKNFGAKTSKLRPPQKKDEPDWWSGIMAFLQRPQRLKRDELEDAELETSQFSEGMPNHMSGFKDHPIYVLERHLKREEVIQPKREIGRFRGEPVYRRANVLSCKTAENWMRIGRKVNDRQEPLKWVKQRAVTIQKRRAQELAMQESGESVQQGLYAEYQTLVYTPPPIKDGIIPTNSFGNIDLYAPTMLPPGAVHLPYKGIAKIAKKLQISYAEACTGFEFKNQRAIPVITGIVVAADQQSLVMDAYEQSAQAAEEREKIKKEERALKRWVKLMNGLRVRRRLQAEYGQSDNLNEQSHNPLAMEEIRPKVKRTAKDVIANTTKEGQDRMAEDLSEEDDDEAPINVDGQQRQGHVKIEPESDADEIQEKVAVPEARLEGIVNDQAQAEDEGDVNADEKPELPTPKTKTTREVSDDEDMKMEEMIPPKRRSIKLRVNGSAPAPAPAPTLTSSRPVRGSGKKRKGSSPLQIIETSPEPQPKPRPKRKGRATKGAPAPAPVPLPVPAPTRSLRSRAPKSQEQEQADRAARARIRAALSEDVDVDVDVDDQDEEEADLEL